MKKKYLIISNEILKQNDNPFVLPIVIYLQSVKGINNKCLTTLNRLLWECGYLYQRTEIYNRHIQTIKEALEILKSMDYIKDFSDMYGINQITLDSMTPAKSFEISINAEAMSNLEKGFLCIDYNIYTCLCSSVRQSRLKLWKVVKLYCCISRRLAKPKSERTLTEIMEYPIYFRATAADLTTQLGNGFSRKTIDSIIKFLNDNNFLHSQIVNPVKDKDGVIHGIGTVFVRDGDFWHRELMAAVDAARNNRRDYYNSGAAKPA